MASEKIIFWFRQDLRISDNPGLVEALTQGPVIPIYIFDETQQKEGRAGRWWLYHSLKHLNASLNHCLNFYKGNFKTVLCQLIETHRPRGIYWNRCYEPWRIQEDTTLKGFLRNQGLDCKSFKASLLWEPWENLKKDGTPYHIYTAFYKQGCLKAKEIRSPLPPPPHLNLLKDAQHAQSLESLNMLSRNTWHKKFDPIWKIGEAHGQKKLEDFLNHGLHGYKDKRNFPSLAQTSCLSPHLHWGEISPSQVWYGTQLRGPSPDAQCFLSEIGWREFSYSLLYHFPELPKKNLQPKFDAFPWHLDMAALKLWQKGQTGYPFVDAGMRQLWQTGFMHNRVRMVVASFLVKNLLIHWTEGAQWFWDCLVDADLANNSAGWQWVAGSGADAAPYFRIFNPTTQGEKFDPHGEYTLEFVPELAKLPLKFLFKPWEAPADVLQKAGVVLGKTYPYPLVSLEYSRKRALEAYQSLSSKKNSHQDLSS